MTRKHRCRHHHDDGFDKWAGEFFEGMDGGIEMQRRYKRIPKHHLNKETVCGIRDMKLGRIKNGKPTGRPIIRFDTGRKCKPHINIDPTGYKGPNNPHIDVSKRTIKYAQAINGKLRYVGLGMTAVGLAVDGYRCFSAIKDDVYVRDHADEIIADLKEEIEDLEEALEEEPKSKKRREIREKISQLKEILKDVRRTKKVPVKMIKTVSSAAGGWTGGAAAGAGGAWAGAYTGALIGSAFGPVGTVVGGPVGAILGGLGFGIGGSVAGNHAGKRIAEAALDTFVD